MDIGAIYLDKKQCEFRVWAPWAKHVSVVLTGRRKLEIPMDSEANGYWSVRTVAQPGMLYGFRLDGKRMLPDPASHFQPKGVHGPSMVVDHSQFRWTDKAWRGIDVRNMVIYELHVGTFTKPGTLDAMIPRLRQLRQLGVNTLEIMPVAACPGRRNWGYDGVYPYAVQEHYGGPEALKRLVNAAHRAGLAVILDVVYNHLGPEGNYLGAYGPYFTNRYKVPWGDAVNFDGPESDPVRDFFIGNALHWFGHYHIDGLRLDAIQAIFDQSAYPFLAQLSDAVKVFSQKAGRHFALIAESDLNESRVHEPVIDNGLGMDASWCDDLHHSLHALVTGERRGYYVDYGSLDMVHKALRDGYAMKGQYSVFRKRRYGSARQNAPGRRLVVFDQNHDQVGNRLAGDRLGKLVSPEAARMMAAATLLSPYIPLLFMGEEYGETSPFLFFADHGDHALRQAVRQGRKREFAAFQWDTEPSDPYAPATFRKSKLRWELRNRGNHQKHLAYYRKLLEIRKTVLDCGAGDHVLSVVKANTDVNVIVMTLKTLKQQLCVLLHCAAGSVTVAPPFTEGRWHCVADSEDVRWGGKGASVPELLGSGMTVDLQSFQTAAYLRKDS